MSISRSRFSGNACTGGCGGGAVNVLRDALPRAAPGVLAGNASAGVGPLVGLEVGRRAACCACCGRPCVLRAARAAAGLSFSQTHRTYLYFTARRLASPSPGAWLRVRGQHSWPGRRAERHWPAGHHQGERPPPAFIHHHPGLGRPIRLPRFAYPACLAILLYPSHSTCIGAQLGLARCRTYQTDPPAEPPPPPTTKTIKWPIC